MIIVGGKQGEEEWERDEQKMIERKEKEWKEKYLN